MKNNFKKTIKKLSMIILCYKYFFWLFNIIKLEFKINFI